MKLAISIVSDDDITMKRVRVKENNFVSESAGYIMFKAEDYVRGIGWLATDVCNYEALFYVW